MKNYVLPNFQTPAGIDSEEKVRLVQRRLGVNDDGIWGPKTQAAYERYLAVQPSISVNNLNIQRKNFSLGQNGMEPIIRTLPGTTNPTIQANGDSALKLHTMINASTLGPSLKNRAKFTIDGLGKEWQDELLFNVILDGVDAYFSQQAWDQGAYSLMSTDPSKRIYENVVLPGEGQARKMPEARLNSTVPMKAANLAASSSTSNQQQTNPTKIELTSSQHSGRVMEEIEKNFDTIMRRMDYSNLSKDEKQSAYE